MSKENLFKSLFTSTVIANEEKDGNYALRLALVVDTYRYYITVVCRDRLRHYNQRVQAAHYIAKYKGGADWLLEYLDEDYRLAPIISGMLNINTGEWDDWYEAFPMPEFDGFHYFGYDFSNFHRSAKFLFEMDLEKGKLRRFFINENPFVLGDHPLDETPYGKISELIVATYRDQLNEKTHSRTEELEIDLNSIFKRLLE